MAVFLFGVALGWMSTFALWFIWSFGLISGLFLGTLAGFVAIAALLLVQWILFHLSKPQNSRDISVGGNLCADPETVTYSSEPSRVHQAYK